jgi:hypothetical protein
MREFLIYEPASKASHHNAFAMHLPWSQYDIQAVRGLRTPLPAICASAGQREWLPVRARRHGDKLAMQRGGMP